MVNNHGTVAFQALLRAGGTGIYTGPDPDANRVIATGDPLFGSTVTDIRAPFVFGSQGQGLNDAGQLVFDAELADGRIVVARADLETPSPSPGWPGSLVALAHRNSSATVPASGWITAAGNGLGAEVAQPARPSLDAVPLHVLQPDQSAQLGPALSSSSNETGSRVFDRDPPRGHATGQPSAPLAPSSSQPGGDVHERIFAEFENNWLSDALLTNLAVVG
jgi:hypothetical protein